MLQAEGVEVGEEVSGVCVGGFEIGVVVGVFDVGGMDGPYEGEKDGAKEKVVCSK